jgi:hypothetical protein
MWARVALARVRHARLALALALSTIAQSTARVCPVGDQAEWSLGECIRHRTRAVGSEEGNALVRQMRNAAAPGEPVNF